MSEEAETPIILSVGGDQMLGILHRPEASDMCRRALVIVVGGPQYRVGSHRLFVTLARRLAADGIAVLRFDYRGQGDSTGVHPGFENADADIEAAIDRVQQDLPSVERVALWGLCDAASAISFYAAADSRVSGIVMVNPWAREQENFDETLLRHYYGRRLQSRDFWRKLVSGRIDAGDFLRRLGRWLARKTGKSGRPASVTLSHKIAVGLHRFQGPILLVLSGNDLTAQEFESKLSRLSVWRKISARSGFERCDLPDADHTFSRADWSRQLCDRTAAWLQSL